MRYTEWKLLTESFGSGVPLGVNRPNAVGGLVGKKIAEAEFGSDADDDDDDWEDEEDEDEEDNDGDLKDDEEEDSPGGILGDKGDEGPEKSFPPDSGEEMDGLPTPDEEMLSGDDGVSPDDAATDDVIAGIDPDLAGLGDEEGEMPPEFGDEEMPPEFGDEEMPPEFGDEEMPPEGLGDEGFPPDDAGDMGDAEDMQGEPCPDCNADGAMEGDPDCQTCQGTGFLDDAAEDPVAMLGGDVEAEVEDAPVDKDSAMLDLMNRMSDYCRKYMQDSPNMMKKEGFFREMAPVLATAGRMAGKAALSAGANMAGRAMNKMSQPAREEKKFCGKGCGKKLMRTETAEEFMHSLRGQAKGTVHKKNSSGMREDALIDSEPKQEPGPGEPGFAPQGRVGQMGGNYAMSDFSDLPVLGESKRWPSLADYAKWKQRHQ